MKNLVTLILILFCTYGYSQYSKKELKAISKAEIKIVNRGLDLDATFIPYSNANDSGTRSKLVEDWKETLFEVGREVGSWSEESNTILFEGRYNFAIGEGCRFFRCVKIYDLDNDGKLAATISWKPNINSANLSFIRRYIIEELIRLN